MGKKHSAKTGGAQVLAKKLAEKKQPVAAASESDEESEGSGNFIGFDKAKEDSDAEEDQEIFNLALGKDDDDDDDDGDDSDSDSDEDSEEEDSAGGDSDGDDDSFEGEENETEKDLKTLLENLPSDLRQQVQKRIDADKHKRRGKTGVGLDDEEEEEEEEAAGDGWGKKKRTYWSGDTADMEIGQEMEDAEEEEAAGQELMQEKLKRMSESDFQQDFQDEASSEEESEEEEENVGQLMAGGKKGGSAGGRAGAVLEDLASVALGGYDELEDDSGRAAHVERLSKDIFKLTRQQRLDAISKQAPELLGIVAELKVLVSELTKRIVPVGAFLRRVAAQYTVAEEVQEYLDLKQQLLLSYCVNVLFYLGQRAKGRSTSTHPVMKQLLKLRYALEGTKALDVKMKSRVDSLKAAASMAADELAEMEVPDLRPREERDTGARGAVADSGSEEGGSEESEQEGEEAVSEDEAEGLENAEEEMEEEDDDVEADDELYSSMRKTVSKPKDKKMKKRARLHNFDDVGEDKGADLATLKYGDESEEEEGGAMDRAAAALRTGRSAKGRGNQNSSDDEFDEDEDEEEDPFSALLAAGPGGTGDQPDNRKRRRAPDSMGTAPGGEDEEEDLMEAFGRKKKAYLAKKAAHYTAEPTYAGYEVKVAKGDKRAASYEIIKNRGLTPSRKKANRNPRVKKRQMYDKAIVRRKGQVRDVITGAAGSYGGEMTGIKANIARSRKIGV